MKDAVFFTVDRTFLPLALATASVLAAEKAREYDVIILLHGDDDHDLAVPDGVQIRPNTLVDRIPAATGYKRPWGAIAYTRILAPLEFKGTYRRLLYLDSDIAALGTIAPLFRLDMGGYPLAASEGMMDEATNLTGFDMRSYKQGLGIGDQRMFNSGMLLIDVEAWCSIDHEKSLHDYVQDIQPRLKIRSGLSGDQEYLNLLLEGQWSLLSPRWNFQSILLRLALEKAVDPVLVHYTGVSRPWFGETYPFGSHHIEYYDGHFRKMGFDDAARLLPDDYSRRVAVNALRGFWFNQVNISAKRRAFEIWHGTREAYRRAISGRMERGEYADIAQGLCSLDLSRDPFDTIGLKDVAFYRKHIWPKRLIAGQRLPGG